MGIYDKIEKYLPEMTEVRAKYDDYLKENRLPKTAEQKLSDYFKLIAASYTFNKEKMATEFSSPSINETLQNPKETTMYGVIAPISARMRYHNMQDLAEFSSFVKDEMYEEKEGITLRGGHAWTYRIFPAHENVGKGTKNEMVRFALNVKPNVGLFKKLDNLCLKHNAFEYKIANEKMYNRRVDPIIIYAQKNNQKEMLADLEKIVKPYRRADEYEMAGYQNLNNGIYTADEVTREQMQQLKYDILTKEEKDVFTHPVEDDFEQDDREAMVIQNIYNDWKNCPVKGDLVFWIGQHEYDYAVSCAQFQAAKMVIGAYKKTRENDLLKAQTRQDDNKSL